MSRLAPRASAGVLAAVTTLLALLVAPPPGVAQEDHPSDGGAETSSAVDESALIDAAYRGLLGREPDDEGRRYWTERLDAGTTQREMLALIGTSTEHHRHVVIEAYREHLDREPDPDGLRWYTGLLGGSVTAGTVEAALLGSAEYHGRMGGGSDDGFLEALYRDVLGREPDEAGRDHFLSELRDGVAREVVASAVLSSSEAALGPGLATTEVAPARQVVVTNLDSIEINLDRAVRPQASTVVVTVNGRTMPGEVSQGDFEDMLVFNFGDIGDPVAPGSTGDVEVLVVAFDGAVVGHAGYAFHYHRPRGSLSRGDEGQAVVDLQNRLAGLGYWVGPVDGRYGRLTQQAVMALQKVEGLERTGVLDPTTRSALDSARRPEPRSDSGYLFEVDKQRQLLILARDGRAVWVWNTSTGTGEPYTYGGDRYVADTPSGRWEVYRQIDGYRESNLGRLYRPKYFHTDGIAVHGYPNVPSHPASHGCVRVTNAAMDWIWANDVMPIGTSMWVY